MAGCEALECLRTPLLGASKKDAQYLGYLFGAKEHVDNAIHVPASLKYLELGGAMERLTDYALFEAIHLVCLTLPEEMTQLGSYSMYRCTDLIAVNLTGIEVVADHAMSGCGSLTLIELGESLTSVGIGALEGCVGLRRLILPFVGETSAKNTYLGYLFGAAVPDFSEGHYPPYLVEVKLLNGCTEIGDFAFYECASLTRIRLPEGVESIGVRAFSGCGRLEAVKLPDTLTTIRESAFYACRSLQKVEIGDGSTLSVLSINAFYACDALQSIKLPTSLTQIPASCFADCKALQSILLGGVQTVGKNAFRGCDALAKAESNREIQIEKGNDALKRCLSR